MPALALLAAIVAPATVWAVLQQLKVPAQWLGLAAGVAVAAPLVVANFRERQKQRDEEVRALARHLRLWDQRRGIPLVREVQDPIQLGVKAAVAEDNRQLWRPPYVRRTADLALDQALAAEPFVLVVGDSAAGKSRSAFEAMHRCFPGRMVVVPDRRESIPTLLNLGFEFQDAVVWLDDLDTYFGPDGLTVGTLERLRGAGERQVTVLATMRASEHAKYGPEQQAAKAERAVLEVVKPIRLDRVLNEDEQRQVAQASDPRLRHLVGRLGHQGLGEYLAAGPRLVERFENARSVDVNPVGAAIVQAAIDWRRAGLTRPTPTDALRQLCPYYLEDRRTEKCEDEEFNRGLAWGLARVVATSALLVEEPAGVRVSDYLLDYVERNPRYPPSVAAFRRLAETVNPAEAYRVGLAAISAYRTFGVSDYLALAQAFFELAISKGGMGVVGAARAATRQLPPLGQYFTGRTKELALLRERLPHDRVVVITGLGGVGKTALAIAAAHQLKDIYPDEQLYVNLGGFGQNDSDPEEALELLLRSLGVSDSFIPDGLEERTALYRSCLAGRRALILLDNATSEQQVHPLLPGHPQSAVLVTSRAVLSGLPGTQLRLGVLDQQKATELLSQMVGAERMEAEPEAAQQIIEFCDGLPLALRIVAGSLNARRHPTLADYLAQLEETRAPLSQHEGFELGFSVRKSFDYAYQALGEAERRAFRLLATVDRPTFDAADVAAVLDCERSEAQNLLDQLVRNALIQHTSREAETRYQMHHLVRLYARERLEDEEPPTVRLEVQERARQLFPRETEPGSEIKEA